MKEPLRSRPARGSSPLARIAALSLLVSVFVTLCLLAMTNSVVVDTTETRSKLLGGIVPAKPNLRAGNSTSALRLDMRAYDEGPDPNCEDKSSFCGEWAAIGECKSNPGYMRHNCRVTCHMCQSAACHDTDRAACKKAAAEGECQRDPERLFHECRWACGWCAMRVNNRCLREKDSPAALSRGTLGATFERSWSEEHAHYRPTVLSRDPWVVTFDSFLSDEETKRVIEVGGRHWQRSQAGDGVQSVRTSSTAWCPHSGCGSDPVLQRLRQRISNLTLIPEENAEHLQVLRYEEGQFYRRHHDQNSPVTSAWGPRLYTFFMYLNDVEQGGETHFPLLNISVKPRRGRAVLWPSVLDQRPRERDDRTDHEAVAVVRGVKYAANYWLHMHDFQAPNLRGCDNTEIFGNW